MTEEKAQITRAHEDYLKAIYHLEQENKRVSTTEVADAMGVSAASATNMLKRLAALHLVEYQPYQGVRLTEAGRNVALEVIRHHRLLELFLAQALGMPWDKVHEEADRLEHVISEELEEAVARFLGEPAFDPHGDPIPTREGVVEPTDGHTLAGLPEHTRAKVLRVRCQTPQVLRYLGAIGIYPGTELLLVEKSPFNGPLLVDVKGEKHAISRQIGEDIIVEPVADAEEEERTPSASYSPRT